MKDEDFLKLLEKKKILQLDQCYWPEDLSSRPTEDQKRVLSDIDRFSERYFVAPNQVGKTLLLGREASWVFQNKHPYWKTRPDKPLTMIIVGQNHSNNKNELWPKKIKPFLAGLKEREDYVLGFSGGNLKTIKNLKNGNILFFFSHSNQEECRRHVQGIVADWIGFDEMPSDIRLINELLTRGTTTDLKFLATFTPLLRSPAIRNHVENGHSRGENIRKYTADVYDNPAIKGNKKQIDILTARFANMSEAERATRETGAWFEAENAVFNFSEVLHADTPPNYHPSWRHVESVDPAGTSKTGYLLLCEDPASGKWYVHKSAYIKGDAATVTLAKIKDLSANVNLVKRVCDSASDWFIKEASIQGISYSIPADKNKRKKELINLLQSYLNDGKLLVTPWCKELKDEFITCQYAEGTDRIINENRYHLLDSLRYAIDVIKRTLPFQIGGEQRTIMQERLEKHKARLVSQEKKQQRSRKRNIWRRSRPVARAIRRSMWAR